MIKAGIIGFASWFPEKIRENSEWPEAFVNNFKSKNIKEEHKTLVDLRTEDTDNAMVIEYLEKEASDPFFGTIQRRVAEGISAAEAETYVAKKVLQKVGLVSKEIDVICSYSTLPDRVMPSSANAIAFNIGATNAHCMSIDTGCASIVSQMTVAKALIESGMANYVLLVQSHIVLRGWPWMHPASPNVGDCATAMVMGKSNNHSIIGDYALSQGEHYSSVTYVRGKIEDDNPWWEPSDKGFYLGSHDSGKARALIMNTLNAGKDTIAKAMKKANRSIEDIDIVASVQPRKWVPEGIAKSLGLRANVAIQTFEKYAHLGPCGVIANLEEAENKNLLKPGTIAALYAQGAGFCRASAIVEW